MNFPTPSNGLYTFNNFFAHYESEHRIMEAVDGENVAAKWVKKSSNHMNHMWDCRVYNHAIKDIIVSLVCKEAKLKSFTWADFVNLFSPSK